MASSFVNLGLLAEALDQLEEALDWVVRGVTTFAEFTHPMAGSGPTHLARLTTKLGIEMLERCWRQVTGHDLPTAVREFIDSGPAGDAGKSRE